MSYSLDSFSSNINFVSNSGIIVGIKLRELNPLQNPLTVGDSYGCMIGK